MNKTELQSAGRILIGGKWITQRKICPSATSYTTNLTKRGLGLKPGLYNEKLATNCISFSTAWNQYKTCEMIQHTGSPLAWMCTWPLNMRMCESYKRYCIDQLFVWRHLRRQVSPVKEVSILLLRKYVDSIGIQTDMIKLNNMWTQEIMKAGMLISAVCVTVWVKPFLLLNL